MLGLILILEQVFWRLWRSILLGNGLRNTISTTGPKVNTNSGMAITCRAIRLSTDSIANIMAQAMILAFSLIRVMMKWRNSSTLLSLTKNLQLYLSQLNLRDRKCHLSKYYLTALTGEKRERWLKSEITTLIVRMLIMVSQLLTWLRPYIKSKAINLRSYRPSNLLIARDLVVMPVTLVTPWKTSVWIQSTCKPNKLTPLKEGHSKMPAYIMRVNRSPWSIMWSRWARHLQPSNKHYRKVR